MPSEKPSPLLLDAVKASASKFKEQKDALEARAKELDALKAHLEAERSDLEREKSKLKEDRDAFATDREDVRAERASIDRDMGLVKGDREKVAAEEKRLQEWARVLNDREKSIKDGEDRIKRLEHEFTGQIKDSEEKFQALIEREELVAQRERSLGDTIERVSNMERGLSQRERTLAKREEELIRLQNERLSALEAREKELLKITEDMHARELDSIQQHESFVELQSTLRTELNNMASEREKLAMKERSLLEAEKYLVAALEASGIEIPAETAHASQPSHSEPKPPMPSVAPPPPPPTGRKSEAMHPAEFDEGSLGEEGESKPRATKAEALDRMTRALETAKKARDVGRNVSEIRKALKLARGAFEAGDYDNAVRLADEILKELEAVPLPK